MGNRLCPSEKIGADAFDLDLSYRLKKESHPEVLALYPSMSYAFDLLQHGEQAGIERAADILRVVLSLQDKDESRDTYGIWPYFYEESLDEMDRPDWNMADFHGKKLVLILKLYADLLRQMWWNKFANRFLMRAKRL